MSTTLTEMASKLVSQLNTICRQDFPPEWDTVLVVMGTITNELLPLAKQADDDKAILDHLDKNFHYCELDNYEIKLCKLEGKVMKFCTYVPHRAGGGTARSRIVEQMEAQKKADAAELRFSVSDQEHSIMSSGELEVVPVTDAEKRDWGGLRGAFNLGSPTPNTAYCPTEVNQVYLNMATGKYTFCDETQNYVDNEWDTKEEAAHHLALYCATALDQPATIAERCDKIRQLLVNANGEVDKLAAVLHASQSKMVYLAAPYSDGAPEVTEARMAAFYRVMAKLDHAGVYTVSPLLKHAILSVGGVKLPGDWAYWQHYSRALLDQCCRMIVICLPGWELSIGVKEEIEYATLCSIPITYVDSDGNVIESPKLGA